MYAPQEIAVSAHPMPTMIILSLAMAQCRSYLKGVGIESVGKRPEDPHRRKFGIGRTFLGQNHHSNDKHEQTDLIPSSTFVSPDPLFAS